MLMLQDGTEITAKDIYVRSVFGASFILKGIDPNSGKVVSAPLKDMVRRHGKQMVRVSTESGRSVEVTYDHRILVDRQGNNEWVRADCLSVGDYIVEVEDGYPADNTYDRV